MRFYKYQGTGNDFVMIDDRKNTFPINTTIISNLCNRRFGIGADGLILLHINNDIPEMVYYNADGNESTMCGNGGRCFVRFMKDLDIIEDQVTFKAIDGTHYAEVNETSVTLQMKNVDNVTSGDGYYYLDTGSPHHVVFTKDVASIDVNKEGKTIRYSGLYPNGTNVNFAEEMTPNRLFVRTYERGVEEETYSCGTGVTATALAFANLHTQLPSNERHVKTLGGNLKVSFEKDQKGFKSVYLIGPATYVFKGKINI